MSHEVPQFQVMWVSCNLMAIPRSRDSGVNQIYKKNRKLSYQFEGANHIVSSPNNGNAVN